ncbi:MAG: SDR family oxidoreductase [Gemmatimonadaceae bacterium]|nr:SDR family oxidoreductase [Gemmatimonadaceae bacterium]
MPQPFADKVAFITGGASGIGAAAARALAAGGAHVVLGDVQYDAAVAVADAIGAAAVTCDVRHDASVAAAIAATVQKHGRLDFALNAAGIGGVQEKTAEYPAEMWDIVIDVNLTGVYRSMRHEIPTMLMTGGGVIVNIASVAGLNGFPRHAAYAASKHGVVGLTRTAALEYGRKGVRINALCPGFTMTPMVQRMIDNGTPAAALEERIPAGRIASAEEIAETVLYLFSPASAFMHGHALAIDGGLTAG